MSQQPVIQILCDRCGKTEIRPISEKSKRTNKEPDFLAQYNGERVEFDDLCKKCKGVASALWARLLTTVSKVSKAESPISIVSDS